MFRPYPTNRFIYHAPSNYAFMKLGYSWPILTRAHKVTKKNWETWVRDMTNFLDVEYEHKTLRGNMHDLSTLKSHQ